MRECGRYGITANAMCPFAATRMTVNDAVIANWKRRVESGLLSQAEFEARMAMPGPEFVAPMVAYLCGGGDLRLLDVGKCRSMRR